jgi:hypothetical protein
MLFSIEQQMRKMNVNIFHLNKIFFVIKILNIIYTLAKRTESSDVLKVIKSQFIRRYKISNDISVDCNATKLSFESICHTSDSNAITGYVQEINQNPFGMILVSEIQVNKGF